MTSIGAGQPSAIGSSISPIPELPGDFEKALPAKLSRAEDIQRYLAASPAWVRVECDQIGRTLVRFAEAVADAMESPRCAHDFMQRLDLRTVSRDHNWRRIFSELADCDPCFDGHKRTLIIRYLQFLSERKRLLDYVEALYAGLEETTKRPMVSVPVKSEGREVRPLAVGETAIVEVRTDGPVSMWMGDVHFTVALREEPNHDSSRPPEGTSSLGRLHLLGPGGYEKQLRLGRNVVGRHPECDIVLNSAWRGLSRAHVILEWDRDAHGDSAPARDDAQDPVSAGVSTSEASKSESSNKASKPASEPPSTPSPDGAPAGAPEPWRPLGRLRVTNLSAQGTSVLAQ